MIVKCNKCKEEINKEDLEKNYYIHMPVMREAKPYAGKEQTSDAYRKV